MYLTIDPQEFSNGLLMTQTGLISVYDNFPFESSSLFFLVPLQTEMFTYYKKATCATREPLEASCGIKNL
jgi:hypothetical protein